MKRFSLQLQKTWVLARSNNMAAFTCLRTCGRNTVLILNRRMFKDLSQPSCTNRIFCIPKYLDDSIIRYWSNFTSEMSGESRNGETSQLTNHSKNQGSPDTKLLRVAIIGEANSGKSTLTNCLAGQKICAVTPIPHTTRKQTLGVFMLGNSQIVLLDTPGIVTHTEARRLKMTRQHILAPREALDEADLIAVITDAADKHRSMKIHESILTALESHKDIPSILILNKIDKIKYKMILLNIADALLKDREKDEWGNYQNIGGWSKFKHVFMISAATGDGIEDIKQYFAAKSRQSEWLFPPDTCTDQPLEEQMQEIFREKLLELYEHEIPWQIKQVSI